MKTQIKILTAIQISALVLISCLPTPPPVREVAPARIQYSAIPSDSVLLYALKPGIPSLNQVYQARDRGDFPSALQRLAQHFKETAKSRYYFSWQDFPEKYGQYLQDYPHSLNSHARMSAEMKAMYAPDTQWQLPFKNLRGEDVTAYRLRHLARQSKHPDMVMMYFADPPERENLKYWTQQMADLNRAFTAGAYDDAGNGVYEVFRAGKRTHHWLLGHHSYLSSSEYSSKDQIESMRTFLHTAAQLAENGKNVHSGNHHTRGMVALFEIAATYREFSQADEWLALAINGITWHLEHEINPDGFQIERTVHYHKSDIENYLRVSQLAQRGNIPLPELYTTQFKKMFDALLVLAQPDGKLPVLQDDTDGLLTETNDLGDVMSLGTILWQDPRYAYFADKKVSDLFYWLLNQTEIESLRSVQTLAPVFGSAALANTGYYVMRNGWEQDDEYMVITAGLSATKPDHQHGDMLGIVAYANGNEILPNYQVKYNEADYRYWKNSWAKNVAMIDSLPQTLAWQGNSGGSGFGKWLDLPDPEVLRYDVHDNIDYFVGRHNGYEKIGISYQREVLFIKAGFWIVKDTYFNSSGKLHRYQQQWQGLYTQSGPQAVVATFDNGATLEIRSLDDVNTEWVFGSIRNKGSVIRQENSSTEIYSQTSLLIPRNSSDQAFPGGWNVVTGELLKTKFPELHANGVQWVLEEGERTLCYSDQVVLDAMILALGHKVFVFTEAGNELLLGPELPLALPVTPRD